MTAILTELRRLDEAHARGDISAAERDFAREVLIRAVPEADAPGPQTDPRQTFETPAPFDALGLGVPHIVLLCLIVVGTVTGAATLLFADFALALTLGITVLAALTVALFRQLEE